MTLQEWRTRKLSYAARAAAERGDRMTLGDPLLFEELLAAVAVRDLLDRVEKLELLASIRPLSQPMPPMPSLDAPPPLSEPAQVERAVSAAPAAPAAEQVRSVEVEAQATPSMSHRLSVEITAESPGKAIVAIEEIAARIRGASDSGEFSYPDRSAQYQYAVAPAAEAADEPVRWPWPDAPDFEAARRPAPPRPAPSWPGERLS